MPKVFARQTQQIAKALAIPSVFVENSQAKNADFSLSQGRKHRGKWRKCWLPAFSPLPTMFSKGLFLRVLKIRDCVVKS